MSVRFNHKPPSRLWQVEERSLNLGAPSFTLPRQSPCQGHRTFLHSTLSIRRIWNDQSCLIECPMNAKHAPTGKPNIRLLLILAGRFAVCWNLTGRNI